MNNREGQNILLILSALDVHHVCEENDTNAKCNTTAITNINKQYNKGEC
jgi:hypothetical protein